MNLKYTFGTASNWLISEASEKEFSLSVCIMTTVLFPFLRIWTVLREKLMNKLLLSLLSTCNRGLIKHLWIPTKLAFLPRKGMVVLQVLEDKLLEIRYELYEPNPHYKRSIPFTTSRNSFSLKIKRSPTSIMSKGQSPSPLISKYQPLELFHPISALSNCR